MQGLDCPLHLLMAHVFNLTVLLQVGFQLAKVYNLVS